MKFFGKSIKQIDKGYFGIRRCGICNNQLRDVNLVELQATNNVFFVPISSGKPKYLLVCQHCGAFMEINDELWKYYQTYYPMRFSKKITDDIVCTLSNLNKELENGGVKLDINDVSTQRAIDLIYKGLTEKYKVWQNIEEIVSVFYQ